MLILSSTCFLRRFPGDFLGTLRAPAFVPRDFGTLPRVVDCFFVDFVEECMEMSLSDVQRLSDLFSVRGLDVFLHWTESCWDRICSLKRA